MNKNSGTITTFHIVKVSFALLFFLQTAYSQICVKYMGSLCEECASNYQLVNGECLSISSASNNASPTLIFQDSPSQKILYRVNPVVILIQSRNSTAEREQSIVSQFLVSKVSNHSNTGNYYVVNTNKTALDQKDISFPNSSVLEELTQAQYITPANNPSSMPTGSTSSTEELSFKKIAYLGQKSQVPVSMIEIGQRLSLGQVDRRGSKGEQMQANLTAIGQRSSEGVEQNLTEIRFAKTNHSGSENANQQENNLTIVSNNNNNPELLFQLQQINQKLTKANLLTNNQPQKNIPNIPKQQETASDISSSAPPPANQIDEISLTEVGQRLTLINQQLTKARLKQQPPIINQAEGLASTSLSQKGRLSLNLSKYDTNDNLIAAKPVARNLTWIKATRYQLYNLTFIPHLSRAHLKSSTNQSPTFTFQCTNHVTLFVAPSQAGNKYAEYSGGLTSRLSKQYKEFTLSDKSTLCLDPPFQQSFIYLKNKYQSVLQDVPLLVAYYQFCGFAKHFRIFFIDDREYPVIRIRQGVMIVDLFRMMPAEVLFEEYQDFVIVS